MDAAIQPRYTLLDDGAAIRCNRCHRVSHNSDDVRQRYCGECRRFHDDLDLPMPPQLRMVVDHIALEARATIAQGREVVPEISVLRLSDRMLWQPRMRMGAPEERDQMAQETRLLAHEHDADAVILLSEAWAAMPTPDASMTELHAQYGAIKDMPHRQDILFLTVETHEHYWQGKAPITGAGLTRRCGEVQYELSDEDHGRFTNFLYTAAEQAKLEDVLARAHAALSAHGVDPAIMITHEGTPQRLIDIFRRVLVKHHECEADEARLQASAFFLAQLVR